MGKGERTRGAIINEALRMAAGGGFADLSLGPLAATLEISKSGLFAHFSSKEALELAVLEEAINRFRRIVVAPAMKKAPGLARLRALYENYLDWIAGADGLSGCPFTALVQEFDDKPGAVRDRLVGSQRQWRNILAAEVGCAISQREFETPDDPAQLAFELIGAALAFEHDLRLLKDRSARARARAAFDRILSPVR